MKESHLEDFTSNLDKAAVNSKLSNPKSKLETKFDHLRMSQMLGIIQNILDSNHISEAFITIMRVVDQIINCSNCCFFIFKNNIFSDKDKKRMIIQKTVVEGRYIDAACLTEESMLNPCFSRISEANNPIYTKENMS